MLICPKCGFQQQQSPECIKCGIVIEKWVEKKKENAVTKDGSRNTNQTLFETVKQLFPRHLISVINRYVWGWKKQIPTGKNLGFKWLRRALDGLIQLLLLLCATWLGYSALLYVCRALWNLYIETPVGRTFVSHYSSSAHSIFEVLNLNLFQLSFSLNVVALKTCLVIGAVCQICSITRYFYLSRGLIARIFFWGFLCSALTCYNMWNSLDMNWRTCFVLCLAPSLSLFGSCFKFTSELLPEFSTILNIKRLKTLID